MTTYIIIFLVVLGFFILLVKGAHIEEDEPPVRLRSEQSADKYINKIKTYFFTNEMFSFEKFCDYIMCIRDDMSINDYSEMILELDMMIKLSQGLREKMVTLLTYDSSILNINKDDFLEMQKNVRANLYEDTFKNLTVILITTLFYLKSKTIRNINIDKGDDIL